jgi:hypothetical protein
MVLGKLAMQKSEKQTPVSHPVQKSTLNEPKIVM